VLENLWRRRRLLGGWLARDYVVVCDRYTLDSIVELRALAGGRPLRLHRWLLRLLARRPTAAFLLEVAPETAWRRKGEQGLATLRAQHALYREEHARLGVTLVDAERPPEELASTIGCRASEALGRRPRARLAQQLRRLTHGSITRRRRQSMSPRSESE
jgi:thymidylate kinase